MAMSFHRQNTFENPYRLSILKGNWGRAGLAIIGFLFLHALSGIFSLKLATLNSTTSPFWIPSGIALAFILLFGRRWALAIFVSALLINLTTSLNGPGLVGVALANSLGAMVSAFLLLHIVNRSTFGHFSEAIGFFFGPLAGATVSSSIGVGTLYFVGQLPFADLESVWLTWLGGDLGGAMIVGPLFLAIAAAKSHLPKGRNLLPLEFAILLAASAWINLLVFQSRLPEGLFWSHSLVLLWANIRLGSLASRFLIVLNCIVATWLSMQNYALFEFGSQNLNLLYLQAVMVAFASSALLMEAMLKQQLPAVAIKTFGVGLFAVVITVSLLAHEEGQFKKAEFKRLVDKTEKSLHQAEQIYSNLLISSAGMLNTHSEPRYADWKSYVNSLIFDQRYHAINGVGFVAHIQRQAETEFVNHIRATGQPQFQVRRLASKYSDQFANLFPITFIEPIEKNHPALGLDLGSERHRREAAELSRKSMRIIASKPVQLVQDEVKRPGFLIFYPIQKRPSVRPEVWSDFIGWTYAPVIAEKFFKASLDQLLPEARLRISQSDTTLFDHALENATPSLQSPFFFDQDLALFGQTFRLKIFPKETFFLNNSGFPLVIGVISTLLLVALSSLVGQIAIFNKRLVSLVEERTKALDMEKTKSLHSAKLASLGQMAAGIAHEINNPLAIVVGNAKLLRHYLNDPNKLNSKTEAILKASHRIEKIVNGLRKFSRSGETSNQQVQDLASVVQEAHIMTGAKAGIDGVQIQLEIEQGLPIFCDPLAIEQVVVNLVSNGIDASKAMPGAWVRIKCFSEAESIVLRVLDSGPGIPTQIEDRLFEPFFTTKVVGEGTGLGLPIVKGILDDHHATIKLNREISDSCFEVRFPKAKADKQAA